MNLRLEPPRVKIAQEKIDEFFSRFPVGQPRMAHMTQSEVEDAHSMVHSLWRDFESGAEFVKVGDIELNKEQLIDIHLQIEGAGAEQDEPANHYVIDSLDYECMNIVQAAMTNPGSVYESIDEEIADVAVPVKQSVPVEMPSLFLDPDGPDSNDFESMLDWIMRKATDREKVSMLGAEELFRAHDIAHAILRMMVRDDVDPDEFDVARFHFDVVSAALARGLGHGGNDLLDAHFHKKTEEMRLQMENNPKPYKLDFRIPQSEENPPANHHDEEKALSLSENAIVPGRRFHYSVGEDGHSVGVDDLDFPVAVQPIIEGHEMSMVISSEGVSLFMDDEDCSDRFPGVVDDVGRWSFENGIETLVMQGIMSASDEHGVLGRERVQQQISIPELTDHGMVFNVTDLLFIDGSDVHGESLKDRFERLEHLKFLQSAGFGNPKVSRISAVPQIIAEDENSLAQANARVSNMVGSRGVMLRSMNSVYQLNGEPDRSCVELNKAIVMSVLVTDYLEADEKYQVSVLAQGEISATANLKDDPADLGRLFVLGEVEAAGSQFELGDQISIEVADVRRRNGVDGFVERLEISGVRLLEATNGRPFDSVESILSSAEKLSLIKEELDGGRLIFAHEHLDAKDDIGHKRTWRRDKLLLQEGSEDSQLQREAKENFSEINAHEVVKLPSSVLRTLSVVDFVCGLNGVSR